MKYPLIQQYEHKRIEEKYNKLLEEASTEEGAAKLVQWYGKKYKTNIVKRITALLEGREKQDKADIDRRLAEAEAAKPFTELIITVEWTKSRTWNRTARSLTNYGFKGGVISGCGYCKLSTATAQALNSHKPIIALLYDKLEKALSEDYNPDGSNNRQLFGYGVGYALLPDFHGGVGESSHQNIIDKLGIGLRMEHIVDTTTCDVFRVAYEVTMKAAELGRVPIIAQWASRGGKYYLILTKDEYGYSTQEHNGGGFRGDMTEAQALAECEQYVEDRAEIDGVHMRRIV